MKTNWLAMAACVPLVAAAAEPLRVAVLDFEDQTGVKADERMGGAIQTAALATKGTFALGQELIKSDGVKVIDRRDFLAQIERIRPTDDGKPVPATPSFLRAAQALNADVVVRGSIQALSTAKEIVNLGGLKTERTRLTMRVGLEALDVRDGAVLALGSGSAEENVRQTEALQTVLSEDDVVKLMEKAVRAAWPGFLSAMTARAEREAAREVVKVSIKTDADPAMVEIDGLLVGTTPIEAMEIYKGDHILTVGKPGHRDITKRVLFDRDVRVEVPMMRTELSAEEWKAVLEKASLGVVVGEPAITVLPLD